MTTMHDALLVPALVDGATPASPAGGDTLIVTFQIAHQQYGLPLEAVIEIVRLPALVSLAGAPPTLCGLLNLRGQYLPVLNGRALIEEPSRYDLSCQVVIAGRGKPELGLLVDRVSEVCTIAASQIRPLDRRDAAAFLSGVFDLADQSTLLIDLSELLTLTPRPDKSKPKTATKAAKRKTGV